MIILFLTISCCLIISSRPSTANTIGWIAVIVIPIYIFMAPPSSRFSGPEIIGLVMLAYVLIPIVFILFLAAVAIHLLSYRLWGIKQKYLPTDIQKDSYIMMLPAGILVAIALLLIPDAPLHGFSPPWLAYIIAVGGAVLVGVASFTLSEDPLRLFMRSVCITSMVILCVCAASPILIAQRAGLVAGNRDYCIFVADKWDYRRMTSSLGLSLLTMRANANDWGYAQHHALLIVDNGSSPEIFHWSYRKNNFVKGMFPRGIKDRLPVLNCK